MIAPTGQATGRMAIAGSVRLEWRELAHNSLNVLRISSVDFIGFLFHEDAMKTSRQVFRSRAPASTAALGVRLPLSIRLRIGRLQRIAGSPAAADTGITNNRTSVKPITGVAFSSDGKFLVTSADDGTIRFWDPATAEPKATFERAHRCVLAVAISPDNNWSLREPRQDCTSLGCCKR